MQRAGARVGDGKWHRLVERGGGGQGERRVAERDWSAARSRTHVENVQPLQEGSLPPFDRGICNAAKQDVEGACVAGHVCLLHETEDLLCKRKAAFGLSAGNQCMIEGRDGELDWVVSFQSASESIYMRRGIDFLFRAT
jgi:hypothetical protein